MLVERGDDGRDLGGLLDLRVGHDRADHVLTRRSHVDMKLPVIVGVRGPDHEGGEVLDPVGVRLGHVGLGDGEGLIGRAR